jgi:hypothetical protein
VGHWFESNPDHGKRNQKSPKASKVLILLVFLFEGTSKKIKENQYSGNRSIIGCGVPVPSNVTFISKHHYGGYH